MFNKDTKEFQCNNCGKNIETGEVVWTKWQFPPKNNASQLKSRKALEFENVPILCSACSEKLIAKF
ncbi:hypothetical protein [Enterococcus sp. AZ109]|uniref:hypothetical protein n=1 Tax=Enterococcus sp. AZ109 TaxID=2774634 RepID=UPI003F22E61C